MYWQENEPRSRKPKPGRFVDYAFRVTCDALPIDHAYPLFQAIGTVLPWIEDEKDFGIHSIHVAESGNGWVRPDGGRGESIHLSRRTRLVVRTPIRRIPEIRILQGKNLDFRGRPLGIGEGRERPLVPADTLFARYVVTDENTPEARFVDYLADRLQGLSIPVRKLLCGRTHTIETPTTRIFTRSVMVADLSREDSLRLQEKGIGPRRLLGCGLFIPHKGIGPVNRPQR